MASNIMSRVLVVGVNKPGHVGLFLAEGAHSLGYEAKVLDTSLAMGSNRYTQGLAWRIDHYPLRIKRFEQLLVEEVEAFRPEVLITTGLSPLRKELIDLITQSSIPVVNYSTDDPWNPAHRSRWFIKALPSYTKVFSTRKSAIADMEKAGVKSVRWLPFAIDPKNQFPEPSDNLSDGKPRITLIGGADKDRLDIVHPIIKAQLTLELWGGYWDKYKLTRPYWRGMASAVEVRKLLSNTSCALTLVRRANRDGHAMRTFEVAAMGAPALAEHTDEHLEILGEEGDNALYFKNTDELVSKAIWMMHNQKESKAMGKRLHERLAQSGNTYADRLISMLAGL